MYLLKMAPVFNKKLLIIFSVIFITVTYSYYQKKKFGPSEIENKTEAAIILNEMPAFNFKDVNSGLSFSKEILLKQNFSVIIVHFWGTWCAPCEAEFPSLIQFAKKFENRKEVKFLLVAVKDENKRLKKFLKKMTELPSNIIIGHNSKGEMLADFGTVKIPETYVFDRNLKTKLKYVGPQNWTDDYFVEQINKTLQDVLLN